MQSIGKHKIHMEWLNPRFGYFYTLNRKLREAQTRFQKLKLYETDEFGRVMMLDGITQVAESCEYQYHEPMVHPALCTHPRPESVLVIGAGDGGIVREVCKYPCVKEVHLAELDDGVVAFAKKYLTSIHQHCFSDPRLQVHITDGRAYVQNNPGRFDAVIMDMTDPFGPSKMLYTREFFREVKRSLRSRAGVFAMHTESPITRPDTFACIQKTLRASFNEVRPFYQYIQMYAVLWSISVSSDGSNPAALSAAAIDKKLARYKIKDLRLYNGPVHTAAQVAYPYVQEILKRPTTVITDKKPNIPDEVIHD